MEKKTPEAARKNMIDLLRNYYGKPADSVRLEWKNISLKRMAAELGYDSGYLSRLLNPSRDTAESIVSYDRVSGRVESLLKVRALEKQLVTQATQDESQKWMLLAITFLLIALVVTGMWGWNRGSSSETVPEKTNNIAPASRDDVVTTNDLRLTDNEMQGVIELYHGYLQYRMAAEGVIFQEKIRSGQYENNVTGLKNELKERVQRVINEGREFIKQSHLRHANGVLMSTSLEEYSTNNNVDQNLGKLLPTLMNKEATSLEIIDAVTQAVNSAQLINKNEREAALGSTPLNRQCCYVLETDEQIESFLTMNGDLNGYEMIYKALLLKDALDNMNNISEQERFRYARERIIDIARSTVVNNRYRYRSMGFITTKGRSITDVITEAQPMDNNLRGADEVTNLLIDRNMGLLEVAELFKAQVSGVQRESWDRVIEIIKEN